MKEGNKALLMPCYKIMIVDSSSYVVKKRMWGK